MVNFVIVAILVVVLGSATAYIIKEKKRGVKCIGCPGGCNSCKSAGKTTSTCGYNENKSTNCDCYTNTN